MKKHRKNSIFLSLISFFSYALVYAQSPHPAFKQYSVEDGLPNSEVYQVKQDAEGYLWFATGNGVSRFNGYEFENFSMNDGLPDNTVFDIHEDHTGRIWFVPISCKLSYYYRGKIYPFAYNDTLQKRLKNPIKSSFGTDKEGNIFLGVKMGGVYKISEKGEITHIADTTATVNVIQTGANDIVYASNTGESEKTMLKFDASLGEKTITLQDSIQNFNLSSSLIKTRKNTIIFSMNKKLHILSENNEIKTELFPKRIIWISEDNEGDLWVGTALGGAYHIKNDNYRNKSRYLPGISINGVLQDREGGFWFASEYDGVFYAPSKHVLTYDEYSGLKGNKINCLATDGEAIYVGLPSGFIHKINSGGIHTYNCNPKDQEGNYISNMHYDHYKNRLLVAGTLRSGEIKNEMFNSKGNFGFFNKIIHLSENLYWSARPNGLYEVTNDSLTPTYPGELILPNRKRTEAIIKSSTNVFFAGTINGLLKIQVPDYTFSYEGDKDALLKNRILDLVYTPDSLMVIATKGAGLLVYNGSEVRQINTQNGLYNDNVNKICVDGPHLWVATNNGLNKITISKDKSYTITGFTTADGIASNEVINVIRKDNKIWVATNRGLSVFRPDQLKKDTAQLPIHIHRVLINEEEIAFQKKYKLKYNQNNIKIHFTGLGYKNAGKLKYRYKMKGLDTAWAYTESREIQFTTLPPAKYSFMVSVLNSNDEWNTKSATIDFTIQKPYWQEWWFRIALVTIFIILVFLLVRYRIKQVKIKEAKNSELNKTLLNLKLKALRAQMNPHFTFNVINSIQHFILHKDSESAYRYLSKFSKLIRVILNNSEKSTILLTEEIKALELYLELEAMRFEKRFDYHIIIDPYIDMENTRIPSMLIQPYVENSIKHGILPLKNNGKIIIELQKQDKLLKCSVEDKGVGRARAAEYATKGHQSLGTSITKNRLLVINKLNNGNLSEKTIDLTDDNGNPAGTRVELFIPIN